MWKLSRTWKLCNLIRNWSSTKDHICASTIIKQTSPLSSPTLHSNEGIIRAEQKKIAHLIKLWTTKICVYNSFGVSFYGFVYATGERSKDVAGGTGRSS